MDLMREFLFESVSIEPYAPPAQASFGGSLEAIATAASLRARAAAGMRRVADLKRRLDSES